MEEIMALYLVQHGISLQKTEDPEQGLSETGMSEVRLIAEVARNYRVQVAAIKHSGKKRANQTAEIFAEFLTPDGGMAQMDGLKPLDDVTALAPTLSSDADLMLIGHLPFMEKLVSFLITGVADKRIFKFQNGGIVCLDQDPEKRAWFIKWALMPKIG